MLAKKGIALLITLLFIMAITVSVGIGLKQAKDASSCVQKENFMLQTSMILDDVLTLLKTSKELELVNGEDGSEILNTFLSQSSFIPLEASNVQVLIEIVSARDKLNINSLVDINVTNEDDKDYKIESFKTYLTNKNINIAYADILLDLMGGVKEDMSYNSDIFYEKPYLFRDYVTSIEHLGEVDDFFMKKYHENSLKNIDFKKIFSFNSDKNTKIDLNYINADVWELILGVDKLRAEEIALNSGSYTKLSDIELNDEEKIALSKFNYSFFEPFLDVTVEIIENESGAKIHFEYDIKNRKGSNFSYEI